MRSETRRRPLAGAGERPRPADGGRAAAGPGPGPATKRTPPSQRHALQAARPPPPAGPPAASRRSRPPRCGNRTGMKAFCGTTSYGPPSGSVL